MAFDDDPREEVSAEEHYRAMEEHLARENAEEPIKAGDRGELKCTPGPWRLHRPFDPGDLMEHYDVIGDRAVICRLTGYSVAQIQADAFLISAAPDLLKVFEAAKAYRRDRLAYQDGPAARQALFDALDAVTAKMETEDGDGSDG